MSCACARHKDVAEFSSQDSFVSRARRALEEAGGTWCLATAKVLRNISEMCSLRMHNSMSCGSSSEAFRMHGYKYHGLQIVAHRDSTVLRQSAVSTWCSLPV
eukprot:4666224-Amphidinium_carterae.1